LAVVALGAGGVAYRPAGAQTVQPTKRAEGKPQSEVEALRKEVELLRLNLLVVLEKVRAQEAELRALRGQPAGPGKLDTSGPGTGTVPLYREPLLAPAKDKDESRLPANVADRIEVALKRLLAAKDSAARQR